VGGPLLIAGICVDEGLAAYPLLRDLEGDRLNVDETTIEKKVVADPAVEFVKGWRFG